MRNIPYPAILILLFLIFLPPAYAQTGQPPPVLEPAIRFDHLTADDGLAQNSVEAILQDSRGLIWIGTQDGLSRFDGYTFTTYKHDPDNPNSLSHNFIRDIFEDRDGHLWITTNGGGANRFDPHTQTFTPYRHDPHNSNSMGGDIVFSVFQDSSGLFWFGGPFSGLTKYDATTNSYTRHPTDPALPNHLPGGGVWDIKEDDSGNLWVAADFALVKYDLKTEQFTSYPVGAGEQRLVSLHLDDEGRVWGGGSAGLYRFDPQTEQFTFIPYPARLVVNHFFVDDASGLFWIASLGEGLLQFDPRTEQFVKQFLPNPTDPHSLSEDRLNKLYRDESGVLWIGTVDRGLDLLNPHQSRFTRYPYPANALGDENVSSVIGNGSDRLWIATGSILNQIDLSHHQITYVSPELPRQGPATIQSVILDSGGELWLILTPYWLTRFNPATGQFKAYEIIADSPPPERPSGPSPQGGPPAGNAPPPGPPTVPTSIFQDNNHTLWITLQRSGLYRFDPQTETFQAYRQPHPRIVDLNDSRNIISNEITVVTGDAHGGIWLGYGIGALSYFDPATQTFTHYQPDNIGWVEAIYPNQNGTLWLATREGLLHFDPPTKTVTRYTEKDGLPSTFITAIQQDESGNLWLSTKKGLAEFNPQTQTFRRYDAADGLHHNEFNARAAWQAPDGQLYFGGNNGFTAFYPEDVEDNPYQPPVILTDFRLFNEPVAIGPEALLNRPIWETDDLTLNHNQNILTFEFSGLNYASPHKNNYRYMLEGFEEKWNAVDSNHRSATYTSLPAGQYTFRVQASNNNGVWSDKEVSLMINVLPPWWETLWFRGLALALVIGVVLGGYRWRVHSIKHQNQRLEQQVAARTEELQKRTLELAQAKNTAEKAQYAAEAANRAKSTFLANMSHELRSPLNAILGFAQVMRRSTTLTGNDRDNLGIIMSSGEHLLSLINQVLDLSKIEAGHIALNPTNFDVYRLLDNVEDMLALKADDKRLQLIIERHPNVPRYIRTDKVKLRQVLLNLLNNAIKFTDEGGVTLRVGIRNQGVGLKIESPPEQSLVPNSKPLISITFEVEDTGFGIAPDEVDSLFEVFSQTESGRQAQEGTGLGLPISREFVQMMGGDIQVKSWVGQGTIFTFTIQAQPVAAADVGDAHATSKRRVVALKPNQPRYRILIVDDKWINRHLVIKLLEPLGFDLREAENGQEAIEVWKAFKPHLIWMDMRMPILNGYEATRRIKAADTTHSTKIIALTASSFEEERAVVLAAGCDDFVRKPFREAVIFEMMHKYIGVQYLYEDAIPQQAVKPKAGIGDVKAKINVLPSQLTARLKEGIELGDMEIIKAAIADIRGHSFALADELAQLADGFEYGAMLQLIEGTDDEQQA